MRLTLLILLTLLLPLAWGWGVNWLVEKWWPLRQPKADRPRDSHTGPPPLDFQI